MKHRVSGNATIKKIHKLIDDFADEVAEKVVHELKESKVCKAKRPKNCKKKR
jgi:hypothetical protein